MAVALPFLSVGPRIQKEGGRLVATTAWKTRLLTLGMLNRTVNVDPAQQTITIRDRTAWFFKRRRRIGFGVIRAVTYSYEDLTVGAALQWTYDSSDLFRVGVRLESLEDIHLFSFYGRGTFVNEGPLPDWLYWSEYAFDLSGTQESESRAFVELLSSMIGVPVTPG